MGRVDGRQPRWSKTLWWCCALAWIATVIIIAANLVVIVSNGNESVPVYSYVFWFSTLVTIAISLGLWRSRILAAHAGATE